MLSMNHHEGLRVLALHCFKKIVKFIVYADSIINFRYAGSRSRKNECCARRGSSVCIQLLLHYDGSRDIAAKDNSTFLKTSENNIEENPQHC